MTSEEFERLPDHAGKQELLAGELITLPPAKRRQHRVSQRLFLMLHAATERILPQEHSNGEVHRNMSYRVARKPDSWLIPDVSLTHPNQPGEDYYQGAPLLAVEVVSPSNTADQIAGKVKVYLANGCREVWVLYPNLLMAWIYREGSGIPVAGNLTSDLLPGVSIDLKALFAD
jgi:Uma2 family endonuclease